MKIKNIFFTILLLTVAPLLMSQTGYLDEISFENRHVEEQSNQLLVNMDIVLDGLNIHSNDLIVLTPVLVSNIDEIELALAPVVIVGNKRSKILQRDIRLNNPSGLDADPYELVRRKNKTSQQITYNTKVTLAEWMKDASLKLRESVTGCADCDKGGDLIALVPRVIMADYTPTYKLTYIVPEVEVKSLSDRHTAMFNFEVGRYELLRNYKSNATEFSEVDKVVNDIRNNPDFEITEFAITGYASPEASAPYNRTLSQNRANSFADYLVSKFNIDRSRFTVTGHGEDWEGLRKAVSASSLADKQAVLNIIDNISNLDARDAELMKLSRGETYRNLLNNYYPPLRRTEYVVAYSVRPFDVDEAREIIKTNPRLLGLNEMYLVAQDYPAGSAQFKEVFDIATRHYPDSDIAILNSASADIEAGNMDAAIERMNRIADNPKVWNNMGVAHALNGDLDTAKEYFSKAVSEGDVDARMNLEELTKLNRN